MFTQESQPFEFRSLTRKIMFESSEMGENDRMSALVDCYERGGGEEKIKKCIKRWEGIYEVFGSP